MSEIYLRGGLPYNMDLFFRLATLDGVALLLRKQMAGIEEESKFALAR